MEILKAVKLYGEVLPPHGLEDPELLLRQEAETWAEAELQKQGRVSDNQELLRNLDSRARQKTEMTEKRLHKLRRERLRTDRH